MNRQKSFTETRQTGVLYLVPTPIGNLEDMTFRSIRLLKEADLIAAEDTRNTIKLLNHFEIETKMISYHQHNEQNRQNDLIAKIESGMTIALVSDAGMPSISDPGFELVQSALEKNIAVVPLPGANAALTALIASGLSPQPFYFYGFLPRQNKERRAVLEQLAKREESWILYESPHRLKETLKAIEKIIGSERKIVLCRELTKRYEEFLRGTVLEMLEWAEAENIRGEFCLVVAGNDQKIAEDPTWSKFSLKEHVEHLLTNEEVSVKEAIKQVATIRHLPKREVYAAYHELK
ncbi:16S rRNA (cytidine(1402)-2'-O)-methyltransferase [Listeria sp. PSOL-1]|uniref:16S rRNA (cytidine(1402)-2'-O)-methyltransferase n=1 Tax=Listeria sp. PSOL-1 TaxID=1844999 RepID=UPI0013D62D87|nr:16S rRNA (cytidine(1402)-2'-O)-methyltransferase [Listeria sp. PSOL-1]